VAKNKQDPLDSALKVNYFVAATVTEYKDHRLLDAASEAG
jgi:hypothetical protein